MKTYLQGLAIYLGIVALMLLLIGCQPSGEKYVQDLTPMTVRGPDLIENPEIVCLAQAIFSESKLPHEQLTVAWTIRNRVESDRYPDSYCAVVFEPRQYSGMSPGDPNYEINRDMPSLYATWAMLPETDYRGRASRYWEDAGIIAEAVIEADAVLDTCPGATHFWSPNVYAAGKIGWPHWAKNVIADCVIRDKGTKNLRFAFYSNIP